MSNIKPPGVCLGLDSDFEKNHYQSYELEMKVVLMDRSPSNSYGLGHVSVSDLGAPGEKLLVLPVLLHQFVIPLQWPLSKATTLWDCQH